MWNEMWNDLREWARQSVSCQSIFKSATTFTMEDSRRGRLLGYQQQHRTEQCSFTSSSTQNRTVFIHKYQHTEPNSVHSQLAAHRTEQCSFTTAQDQEVQQPRIEQIPCTDDWETYLRAIVTQSLREWEERTSNYRSERLLHQRSMARMVNYFDTK